MPIGDYVIAASAAGFKKQLIERLRIEIGRRITQDFQLEPGDISEQVTITSATDLIDRATAMGHVIDRRTGAEIPLNGRYFLDLALLVPGSVTPPQGAFSSAPMRGLGSFAINTAGNVKRRSITSINGITLNNLTISVDHFSAVNQNCARSLKWITPRSVPNTVESSGAVVNIATQIRR